MGSPSAAPTHPMASHTPCASFWIFMRRGILQKRSRTTSHPRASPRRKPPGSQRSSGASVKADRSERAIDGGDARDDACIIIFLWRLQDLGGELWTYSA